MYFTDLENISWNISDDGPQGSYPCIDHSAFKATFKATSKGTSKTTSKATYKATTKATYKATSKATFKGLLDVKSTLIVGMKL